MTAVFTIGYFRDRTSAFPHCLFPTRGSIAAFQRRNLAA
jgi:hypothetical protein